MTDESSETGFHLSSTPDRTEITQPRTEKARQAAKLPLRLLLVSDLTPQKSTPNWEEATSRVRSVDKYSFDELMAQMAPALRIEVPNRISETPAQLDLHLEFPSLESFRPDALVRQIPALDQLFELRQLVVKIRDGKIDLDTFQERIQDKHIDPEWARQLYQTLRASEESTPVSRREGTPARPSASDEETVDRILGMVETEADRASEPLEKDADETAVSDIMETLVRAAAGDSTPSPTVDAAAADQLLSDLDSVLSDQLNALMSRAEFRRSEAAWRGLKFLIDRINFRENIHLEVLSAPKQELEEALHYQVLMPEHRGETDKTPVSLIVLDTAFGPNSRDIRHLEDLTETGASLQIPIVASADPSFFNADQPEEMARMPVLKQLFQGEAYAEWNSLRDREETKFLTLALPPFLLRYPYGMKQPVEGFRFEESGHLWGNASLAVAAMVADSFAATGWPTHLDSHPVENLPVRSTTAGAMPVSALFPVETQAELSEAGFAALGAHLNRDFVYAEHLPTVYRPETYDDPEATAEARTHASLSCQLFVSRAAQFLLGIQEELKPGQDMDRVREDVKARLESFLGLEGASSPEEAISIEPVEEAEIPGKELLAVRLYPPRSIFARPVSLVMGLQVPGGKSTSAGEN
jgi:type VI secretion system protein ImpC